MQCTKFGPVRTNFKSSRFSVRSPGILVTPLSLEKNSVHIPDENELENQNLLLFFLPQKKLSSGINLVICQCAFCVIL